MEVDDAASLELGDFGVGEPDPDAAAAGEPVEAAPQGDDGAAPQLGRVTVPDDGARCSRSSQGRAVCRGSCRSQRGGGDRTGIGRAGRRLCLRRGAAPQDLAARAVMAGCGRARMTVR